VPYATICKGCWQQKRIPIPLGGALSLPLRAVGIRRSRMNPNTCTICETMFERMMKARTIAVDGTILFADLRAYASLSQTLAPAEMSRLLDAFYDVCATAIWAHDGLLNKTIGDAVMAVFNFPLRQADQLAQAVAAARDIRRHFAESGGPLGEISAAAGTDLGVGIGIDTGELSFGEFGNTHRDVTAIGTVVNRAARIQAAAERGQILLTEATHRALGEHAGATQSAEHTLKGFDRPIRLYAL